MANKPLEPYLTVNRLLEQLRELDGSLQFHNSLHLTKLRITFDHGPSSIYQVARTIGWDVDHRIKSAAFNCININSGDYLTAQMSPALKSIEDLIVELETAVSDVEARKYCAVMFRNNLIQVDNSIALTPSFKTTRTQLERTLFATDAWKTREFVDALIGMLNDVHFHDDVFLTIQRLIDLQISTKGLAPDDVKIFVVPHDTKTKLFASAGVALNYIRDCIVPNANLDSWPHSITNLSHLFSNDKCPNVYLFPIDRLQNLVIVRQETKVMLDELFAKPKN